MGFLCVNLVVFVTAGWILSSSPSGLKTPLFFLRVKVYTQADGKVNIHPKSVNAEEKEFNYTWLIYHLKMKTSSVSTELYTRVSTFERVSHQSGWRHLWMQVGGGVTTALHLMNIWLKRRLSTPSKGPRASKPPHTMWKRCWRRGGGSAPIPDCSARCFHPLFFFSVLIPSVLPLFFPSACKRLHSAEKRLSCFSDCCLSLLLTLLLLSWPRKVFFFSAFHHNCCGI